MKKLLSLFSVTAFVFSLLVAVPQASAAIPLDQVMPGDLVRGESFSAVYYMGEDGMRYVFPNDKTYFTWFTGFDGVKFLTDSDLAKIQIGGNVTYRPGVKMIKINSDPKTYAVGKGGTLWWVTSEQVAVDLYGTDWNTKIDDVADAFFSNYSLAGDINQSSDFDPAKQMADSPNINEDKELEEPVDVSINDGGFSSPTTVDAGRAVRFTNHDTEKHTATADDLSWGTGTLNPGDSFIRYFNKTGTFNYMDSYNPGLNGVINVE